MAAVVDSHSCQVEAAGITTHVLILFQNGYASTRATAQLKRRAQSRWARAQDYNVGLVCQSSLA